MPWLRQEHITFPRLGRNKWKRRLWGGQKAVFEEEEKELGKCQRRTETGKGDCWNGTPDLPPHHHWWSHKIITLPGMVMNVPALQGGLQREVDKMLELGMIEESQSSWCNLPFLVLKPDGSICFCIDLRQLNAVFTFDTHPMSWINAILHHVCQAWHLSSLDFSRG